MNFLNDKKYDLCIYICFVITAIILTTFAVADETKIIIIDSNVPEYQTIINNISPDYKIHVLKSKTRFDELSNVINKYENINELHLISHGSPGSILLGTTCIDADFLKTNYIFFKLWKKYLSRNSNINLYGCNIASGTVGQTFINKLSGLIETNISASEDITGSALLNGNWELEFKTGFAFYSNPITGKFIRNYSHILNILPVTNTLDDTSAGTLRQIINSASFGDTIIFTGISYPDTIRLTQGEINIFTPVMILGPGADSLSISGEDTSRIFSFGESGAWIHGLSLNNGYADFGNGGAFNLGSTDFLHLYDCIISDNEAIGDSTQPSLSGLGGAIYNNGDLRIYRSSIFNNNSIGGQSSEGLGGAIYQTNDTCIINNCTFSNNTVRGRSGFAGNGGGIYVVSGIVDISNSTFTNNNALNGSAGGVIIGVEILVFLILLLQEI